MSKQIYIGLGGQGAKSICALRKQIHQLQLYKKANAHSTGFDVPCAFLSIDSSPDIWNTEALWQHMGKDLSLKENEHLQLRPEYINIGAPNINPWLYSSDPETRTAQESTMGTIAKGTPGAQQRRRYGRLLFAANADRIRDAIQNVYGQASDKDSRDEAVFHVFCSLGGGTGSGGIVDLVTMIRQLYPNSGTHPIHVYVYMADERGVAANAVQGYFFENQYCALRDLDNLTNGILRPHAMINSKSGILGARINPSNFQTPISCIHISTNINSRNQAVSINDQIKRTASWALQLATLSQGSTDDIHRIITLEDASAQSKGEPNDPTGTFLARSIRTGNLGTSRWAAPVDELALLAAYDIQLNAYRQMLYNNREANGGYTNAKAILPKDVLASYHRISPADFTLDATITAGWKDWADNNSQLLALLDGKSKVRSLTELDAYFSNYYATSVESEGDQGALAPSSREALIITQIMQNMGMAPTDQRPASFVHLYRDFIKSSLTYNWDEGSIGLEQAVDVVDYCLTRVTECETQLGTISREKQPGGVAEAAIQERIDLRIGEWEKLTALSYATMGKGKAFVKAHIDDLVQLYTSRTQYLQIIVAMQGLQTLIKDLRALKNSLMVPIEALKRLEESISHEYTAVPLRRFLFEGATPGKNIELEYDYSSTYAQMLHHVHTNMDAAYGVTIAANATLLRQKAIEVRQRSRQNDSLIGLFNGSANVDAVTLTGFTDLSFESAGTMLRAADDRYHTRNMEGIKSRSEDLRSDEFRTKFRSMLDSAAFSYDPDRSTPAAEIAYRNMQRSPKAWVVSFPEGFKIDGVECDAAELKRRVQDAIGLEATDDSVHIRQPQDTTQVSIWETEYFRPARMAAIVATVGNYNRQMDERGVVGDFFWRNIDDEATKLMCPLTFPNADELAVMREGAMWFARNLPEYFTIDTENGKVYRSFDEREIHDMNNLGLLPNTTMFAYDVQMEVRKAIVNLKDVKQADLRAKYKEELKGLTNLNERSKFRRIIEEYVEKTLARIDLELAR